MRVCLKPKRALVPITTLLALAANAAVAQQVPITVVPSPPPGISEPIQRLLSWLAWGGWIAVAAAFILGAINFIVGDSEKGKKYIAGAIIGAIIMAFYSALIAGLIG
ncbi:MAG: hypothetical protein QXK88_01495 [Desulfurococcaceae archaeon]